MRKEFQKAVCITAAATMTLAGCGTPKTLDAIPVPPTRYAHLDCEQLNAEAQRVLARYVELGGKIDEATKQREALPPVVAPLVVLAMFTPLALLLLPLSAVGKAEVAQREEEYRRLMGERDAILKVAAEKDCPGVAQQQSGKGGTELSPPKAGGESPTMPDASK